MAVSDGTPVNAANSNASFMSRTTDTSTTGEVALNNVSSGGTISNAQQAINDNTTNIGTNTTNIATNASDITDLQNDKIDKVNPSTDHSVPRHDGATGTLQDSGVLIDDSDNVTIPGDLTVNGTTTTINTSTMDVEDANITVNDGGDQATANSNVAGFTVEMSDATDARIGYDSTLASRFKGGEVGSESEIITSTATQDISNKTVSDALTFDEIATPSNPAVGENKLYFKADGNLYKLNDVGSEIEVGGSGGGSGQGRLNYVLNPDAEVDLSDINEYDDVGATPVDGIGGSHTDLTLTRIIASQLRGSASFQLDKAAADAQGEGISFELDDIDKQDNVGDKTLHVTFDYEFDGADGDVGVYVYNIDVPEIRKLRSENDGDIRPDGGSPTQFVGQFEAFGASDSYRLIFHVQSTSATAWTLRLDSVSVSPDTVIPGAIITDVETDTLTIGAVTTAPTTGTVANNQVTWWREGRFMNLRFDFNQTTAGTTGSGTYLFPIPGGHSIDLDFYVETTTAMANVGSASLQRGATEGVGTVHVYDADNLNLLVTSASAIDNVGSGFFALDNADVRYSFQAKVAIDGWSAGAAFSTTEKLLRTARVVATSDAGVSIPDASTVDFVYEDVSLDTLGSYNSTTGVFTAPHTGVYVVLATISITGTTAGTGTMQVIVSDGAGTFLRRSPVDLIDATSHGEEVSTSVFLDAGDEIKIQVNQTNGAARNTATNDNQTHLTIFEVPDFSTFSVFGETEIVESKADAQAYGIANGTWGDLTSISLGPGEWDITGVVFYNGGGAAYSTARMGIGENAGTVVTDLVFAENTNGGADPGTGLDLTLTMPVVNKVVTSQQTFYLKSLVTTGTNLTDVSYRITARRIK